MTTLRAWKRKNKNFIKALQTVHDFCYERINNGCENCPMYDSYHCECMIRCKPYYWEIGTNIVTSQLDKGAE